MKSQNSTQVAGLNAGLKVRSAVKAGGMALTNHNVFLVRGR
jgi:hypothetical protein